MVEVAFTVDVEGLTVEATVETKEVETLVAAELLVDGLIEVELEVEGLAEAVDVMVEDLAAVVATTGP